MAASDRGTPVRFGVFELDSTGKQLRKNGQDLRLPQQPLKVLTLLVERPDEIVTREELRAQLWPSDVFVDFDHGLNKSIQRLRDALGDSANSPRYIETVPKVGYRFIAPLRVEAKPHEPAISTPVVAAAAAAAPSVAEPSPQPSTHNLRKKWPVALAAIALLAVLGGWSVRKRWSSTESIHSLAVIPLQNLSGDSSQEYFADGMTDELVTMLAKESNLRITSRTSMMQYKNAHRPLTEIARELHVDAIVEGSVSKSQDRIHLNLQLIRADTDSHLWAESYDRNSNDTQLSSEAATAISKQLHSYVGSNVTPRPVNPEAHDALMRGKYLWFTDKMMDSGPYFQKATQMQPDYADAWAWLSAYYGEAYAMNLLESSASSQPMWEAAQRAMQLDPDLPDSHWALGASYFLSKWDFASAERELRQAIRMNPQNPEYYYVYSNLLEVLNRYDEAIEVEKKAMELDPLQRPEGLAAAYFTAGRYDDAIADLRLREKAFSNNTSLLWAEFETWRRKGDYKQASETWAKWHLAMGDPKSAAQIRRAYAAGGKVGFMHWIINRRLEQSKTGFISPGEFAIYHAQLGDKEETIKLLEESYKLHTIDAIWIQTDPAYNFLHSDPRYRELVHKTGLPPSY